MSDDETFMMPNLYVYGDYGLESFRLTSQGFIRIILGPIAYQTPPSVSNPRHHRLYRNSGTC